MKTKRQGIIILGSTGSIGKSTLDVISQNPDLFRVDGISCLNNITTLAEQIKKYQPQVVATGPGKAEELDRLLVGYNKPIRILEGREGFVKLAQLPESEKLVAAMVGAAGIEPVIAGIRAGKTIALANKESLVLAGSLMLKEATNNNIAILPIDSEHNAIFQSLYGEQKEHLAYITLTASGGPFRTKSLSDFRNITVEQALNHPNWSMGKKITIDSATMMNKCLEIIEAKWLFDIQTDQIKVLIHPQSIVHSMVTFKDASTICQMGTPDMKIPIANCLGYPKRINSGSEFLDLSQVGTLTFENPDLEKFPSIQMAYDVLEIGGGAPAALNGANEILVGEFLSGHIEFVQIFDILKALVQTIKEMDLNKSLKKIPYLADTKSLEDAIQSDQWGRDFAISSLSANSQFN